MIRAAGPQSFLWYHLLALEVWGRIFLNDEKPDEVRARAFLERRR